MQSLRGNGGQNGRQNGKAAVRLIVSAFDTLDDGVVLEHEHRAPEFIHVRLCREDGVVGHDLFEHLAHGAQRVLLQPQTLLTFVVQHAQREQDGGLSLGEDEAVCLVRVDDVKAAVRLVVPQIPVEQTEIIAHGLKMDGQKGIVRVVQAFPARAVQRAHDKGAAEQLIADRLELLKLLRGRAAYKIQIHFSFSFRLNCTFGMEYPFSQTEPPSSST